MANMNIYDYTEGDVTFHSMHDLRAKLEKTRRRIVTDRLTEWLQWQRDWWRPNGSSRPASLCR